MERLCQDVLLQTLAYFRDDRFDTTFPLWWTQTDMTIAPNARFVSNLALVSRSWREPARRISLRSVRLYMSQKNVDSWLSLVRRNGQGWWVKTLILDFPFSHEGISDMHILQIIWEITMFCPNIKSLHIDNIPHSAAVLLHSYLNITSLPLRSFGLRASPKLRETVRAPRAFIPALYDLQQLALWGFSCDIHTSPDSVGLAILEDLHIFACDIDDDFTAGLSRTPLRKLTIGEADVNVSALVSLVTSSKKLRVFQHFAAVPKESEILLDPFQRLKDILWSTGRQFNECEHPLGYTFESTATLCDSVPLFTDHCHAIAFEIPAKAAVEAAYRIGCREGLLKLDAYFSALEGKRLTVVRCTVEPPASVRGRSLRMFACYIVKPLFGVQTHADFPSGTDWVQESPVKRLLGCEDSLTQGYFIQNPCRTLSGTEYARR